MEVEEFIKKVMSMNKKQKFIYFLNDYNNPNPFYITELERAFGYKFPQQDLRKVVSILIEMDIIINFEKVKGDIRYKLNKKKLQKLIRDSEVFLINGKFIEKTTIGYHY